MGPQSHLFIGHSSPLEESPTSNLSDPTLIAFQTTRTICLSPKHWVRIGIELQDQDWRERYFVFNHVCTVCRELPRNVI